MTITYLAWQGNGLDGKREIECAEGVYTLGLIPPEQIFPDSVSLGRLLSFSFWTYEVPSENFIEQANVASMLQRCKDNLYWWWEDKWSGELGLHCHRFLGSMDERTPGMM